MQLTDRQRAFIDEYLLDLNATKAAVRAGYAPSHASNAGFDLRKHPLVSAEIARRQAERAQHSHITEQQVLLEIARLAFNDPRQAFDANGALLPVQDWPDNLAAAVASVKVLESKSADGSVVGEVKEIKFWDKGKQLELAARHLGLLKDRLEISTPVGQMIKAARARLRDS